MANVPAAGHALDVLTLLGRRVAPLPASAIARDLGLPRSTTYHLLDVLREEGFVVHLPEERRYGLGTAAFELGSAYARQEPLRWIAAKVLARLVEDTTHNGHFAVLDGRDTLYLIEERAPGRASLVTEVGVRLPAPLTASGLAMLAALPARQVAALWPTRADLVRRHDAGPASLSDLRALLVAVRRTGHAYEDGFVTPGFASVASAVLDHNGYPVAAVALTFPAGEVDAAAREALRRGHRRGGGERRGAHPRPDDRPGLRPPRGRGARASSRRVGAVVAQAVVQAAAGGPARTRSSRARRGSRPSARARDVAPREPRLGLGARRARARRASPDDLALRRGPRGDLAAARARGEVRVALLGGQAPDRRRSTRTSGAARASPTSGRPGRGFVEVARLGAVGSS